MYNTWETMEHVTICRGEKIAFALSSRASENANHGKANPRDYTPDERIFHAPCIFLPDVSNPRHIERMSNFPRRWEARDRKARSNPTRTLRQENQDIRM